MKMCFLYYFLFLSYWSFSAIKILKTMLKYHKIAFLNDTFHPITVFPFSYSDKETISKNKIHKMITNKFTLPIKEGNRLFWHNIDYTDGDNWPAHRPPWLVQRRKRPVFIFNNTIKVHVLSVPQHQQCNCSTTNTIPEVLSVGY